MSFPTTTFFLTAAYVVSLISFSKRNSTPNITYPFEDAILEAGSKTVLSWDNPFDDDILEIALIYDPSDNKNDIKPQHKTVIAANVNSNDLNYIWNVSLNIYNGDRCILEFRTSTQISRSKAFIIRGGKDISLLT
ncbi:MAG: hypothetical protein EXX96DRAFT_606134 [Benjaminiella poitrasii]|nr:MAG: hypothetical protein EXX96DRAFT_606134 [Benjaminiella poitrasii]